MSDTRPINLVHFHPDELTTYGRNPRIGDLDAITESLQVNGQYRPVVVNLGSKTGRPLEVLAGNHTLAAARQLGWDRIAATTVDVDDTAAARIVAVDNRAAALGDYDSTELERLLRSLPTLDGTGYDDDYLDRLAQEEDTPDSADLFDDLDDNYTQKWGVIIPCTSEADQERTRADLDAAGYEVKTIAV